MCAKNHLLIFSSFLDIWENVEWPRFFWTTLYMYISLFATKCRETKKKKLRSCQKRSRTQIYLFIIF